MSPTTAGKPSMALYLGIGLAVLLALNFVVFWYAGPHGAKNARLAELLDAERRVAEMQTRLMAAAEAEKSAVMAESDQDSGRFAAEAKAQAAALEAQRQALARNIGGLGETAAKKFQDFSACWKHSQELDAEVLGLAVENTNLKAFRLADGPSAEALRDFDAALEALAKSTDDPATLQHAAEARVSAYAVAAMYGRHILEPSDAAMDTIEAAMRERLAQVRTALDALQARPGAAAGKDLPRADQAWARFLELHGQIIALSRRNTNVRSLALSIGQKRQATAQCAAALAELHQEVEAAITGTKGR